MSVQLSPSSTALESGFRFTVTGFGISLYFENLGCFVLFSFDLSN